MDELPDDARELLKLARDMHDVPDAEARLRVRRGVAVAVATGVGVTIASHALAQGTLKTGLFGGVAAKLAGAGMAVAMVSAVAVAAPHFTRTEQQPTQSVARPQVRQARPRREPAAAVVGAAASPRTATSVAPAAAPVSASPQKRDAPHIAKSKAPRHPVAHRAASRATVATQDLRSETVLLSRAAQAIAGGNTAQAERALDQHETAYRDSALREERDGLRALIHCLQNPARAYQEGLKFVTNSPESVLAQRVARACQLKGKS